MNLYNFKTISKNTSNLCFLVQFTTDILYVAVLHKSCQYQKYISSQDTVDKLSLTQIQFTAEQSEVVMNAAKEIKTMKR